MAPYLPLTTLLRRLTLKRRKNEYKHTGNFYKWYALLKKYVFKSFLNIVVSSASRRFSGRLFHREAAAYENILCPNVFVRTYGTVSNFLVCDRRTRGASYGVTRSRRYCGPVPGKALNVNTSTLNCILYRTGSQWRSISADLMDSRLPI